MSFFSDHRGNRYPTRRIRWISGATIKGTSNPTGVTAHRVFLDDGDDVIVTQYELDSVLRATARMIPAAAGTFLLGKVDADDQGVADVFKYPVIGYAISDEGEVTPFTVDGPDDGLDQPGPILTPDGMVTEQGSQCWKSIEDWFASERARVEHAEPEPPLPKEGDPSEVFDRHARWVAAQMGGEAA